MGDHLLGVIIGNNCATFAREFGFGFYLKVSFGVVPFRTFKGLFGPHGSLLGLGLLDAVSWSTVF